MCVVDPREEVEGLCVCVFFASLAIWWGQAGFRVFTGSWADGCVLWSQLYKTSITAFLMIFIELGITKIDASSDKQHDIDHQKAFAGQDVHKVLYIKNWDEKDI